MGRAKSDGRLLLQAYGIASYDDATGKYHMRAFNDGRWLETDTALADNGRELTWGFAVGDVRTKSTLRPPDAIAIGTQSSRRFMGLSVKQVHAK